MGWAILKDVVEELFKLKALVEGLFREHDPYDAAGLRGSSYAFSRTETLKTLFGYAVALELTGRYTVVDPAAFKRHRMLSAAGQARYRQMLWDNLIRPTMTRRNYFATFTYTPGPEPASWAPGPQFARYEERYGDSDVVIDDEARLLQRELLALAPVECGVKLVALEVTLQASSELIRKNAHMTPAEIRTKLNTDNQLTKFDEHLVVQLLASEEKLARKFAHKTYGKPPLVVFTEITPQHTLRIGWERHAYDGATVYGYVRHDQMPTFATVTQTKCIEQSKARIGVIDIDPSEFKGQRDLYFGFLMDAPLPSAPTRFDRFMDWLSENIEDAFGWRLIQPWAPTFTMVRSPEWFVPIRVTMPQQQNPLAELQEKIDILKKQQERLEEERKIADLGMSPKDKVGKKVREGLESTHAKMEAQIYLFGLKRKIETHVYSLPNMTEDERKQLVQDMHNLIDAMMQDLR